LRSRIHRFESYGVRYDIGVHGSSSGAALSIRNVQPPGAQPAGEDVSSRRYDLYVEEAGCTFTIDDGTTIKCRTVRDAQDLLEGEVAIHVAASAPEVIFIHAGVVGWKGRALILPGRTMTGKSSLVRALVARGATYYSDEYALIDREGRIHPYARRMSLRRPSGPPRRMLPSRLGRKPIEAGWVLGSQFEPARKHIELATFSPGKTALLLLDNAIAARLAPARVLTAVRRVGEVARGGFLYRGESSTAAKELLPLLGARGILGRISK
jgi:hypothetical protein